MALAVVMVASALGWITWCHPLWSRLVPLQRELERTVASAGLSSVSEPAVVAGAESLSKAAELARAMEQRMRHSGAHATLIPQQLMALARTSGVEMLALRAQGDASAGGRGGAGNGGADRRGIAKRIVDPWVVRACGSLMGLLEFLAHLPRQEVAWGVGGLSMTAPTGQSNAGCGPVILEVIVGPWADPGKLLAAGPSGPPWPGWLDVTEWPDQPDAALTIPAQGHSLFDTSALMLRPVPTADVERGRALGDYPAAASAMPGVDVRPIALRGTLQAGGLRQAWLEIDGAQWTAAVGQPIADHGLRLEAVNWADVNVARGDARLPAAAAAKGLVRSIRWPLENQEGRQP